MKKALFTIVAKNYIGLAQILGQSIIDKDVDFYIIVADELTGHSNISDSHIIEAKTALSPYISAESWMQMSFMYNLTEFCTAIKPFSFKLLADRGYDSIVYMDPDICVYSSLEYIYNQLEKYSIILTPQLAECHVEYKGHLKETDMHLNGIYNLGFLGISVDESTLTILDWWSTRLRSKCFMDKSRGLFTDQKWIDFVPGFPTSKGVKICHHLGMNLAPWNYFERKIFKKDSKWYVMSREGNSNGKYELIFTHFSGYRYKQMACGNIKRQDRVLQPTSYEDIDKLLFEYTDVIKSRAGIFNQYIDLPYTYLAYDNGVIIEHFHRRLFHGLIEKGYKIDNPFNTSGKSFFKAVSKAKLLKRKSETSPDEVTMANIQKIDKKKKAMEILLKILKRIMGYNRYALFTRGLPNYYRPEEHLFLIKNEDFDNS